MDEPDSSGRAVARRLEARRQTIIARYEEELRKIGSPILNDETALYQARQNAENTLEHIISTLANEATIAENGIASLSERIGIARASHGIRPEESIQAAETLFEVLVASVQDAAAYEAGSLSLVGSAVRALNHIMMTRIRVASLSYASYLLDAIHQEHINERARIARELHDHIGNGIEVAYRQIELVELHLESRPARSAEILSNAKIGLQGSLEKMRLLIAGLRMSETDRIETALNDYIDSVMPENIDVVIEVNGDEQRCGDTVRGELFLIIREALHNALQHARPSSIYAKIDISPREVWAMVEDDGVGFDPDDIPATSTGLASMTERLALLDGQLKMEASAESGTRIVIQIPLQGWPLGLRVPSRAGQGEHFLRMTEIPGHDKFQGMLEAVTDLFFFAEYSNDQ
jgi:signal transduction histidine kinase